MHKLLIALMTAVFAVSPVYAASHTKDEKKAETTKTAEAKKDEAKKEEMKDEKKTEAKKEETKKKKPKGGC